MNLALSAVVIVLASATEATAADPPETSTPPTIGVAARSCPTRDAVAAAVSSAVAHLRPGLDPLPSDFRIVDLGDAFEVTAGGQAQQYADAARDCAERARVAAVFVALALNPPSLALPPAPAPAPAVGPGPVQPIEPPPARRQSWISVGLAARLDGAVGGGANTTGGTSAGGEIEVALGRGSIGVEATAGVVTSTETAIGSVRVGERRFPCSLSAALRRRTTAHLEVRAGLGLSLTPLTLRGQGLDSTLPVTRLDVGARLAIELRVVELALAPFASLHLEYFPRTYDIAVDPLGDIGTTAPFQIGLSLGMAFDTWR
jgi:hypothetical protein